MYLKKFLLLYCCMCFGLHLLTVPLWAEETEDKTVAEMESITVTANKIEEDVQKIPQSITVMDEAFLEEKGITDVPDVIREIPNMVVQEGLSGNSVSFRGLNSSTFTYNNPVVIYIDGVPVINQYGFDASLVNVERVEVLRGPQGTLYGKDAIGGVINIVTKEPENQWHGMVGAEYGSYNYMQGIFNLNGSVIKDSLFMGINGKYEQDDGWIENTNPGADGNESDQQQFSGYLLYTPTDRFTAKLTLSMANQSNSWINGYKLPAGADYSDFNRDDAEKGNFSDMPTEVDIDCFSQSLYLSYAFDSVTLTSISTHRKQDMDGDYDGDYLVGTDYDGLKQFNYNETDAYTQELRISSNNKSGIRWVAGLYIDSEEFEQQPLGMQYPSYDKGAFNGNFDYFVDSEIDSTTYAAFGQAIVPLGERFELTLGGRYQHIDKEIDLNLYVLPVGTTGFPSFSLSGDKDWDVFLPKAALSYALNDNWHTYISYSQGYMPGGFNPIPSSGTIEDNSFEPQKSANYEIGIKGSLNKLRLAANLFYMDIEDIHIFKSDGVLLHTSNADSGHSQGVELELAYQLTNAVELTGSIGLIEAEYDNYDAGDGISYDGKDIAGTPSYTATAGVSYKHPSGLYGRVDMRAVGETSFDEANLYEEDAYVVFDAKIGYLTGGWDFYVYGKNLTDEAYFISFDGTMAEFGPPMTIGVGLRYRF